MYIEQTKLRKAAYGLAVTCILGGAVYVGYRVAAPDNYSTKRYRHPELNDEVSVSFKFKKSEYILMNTLLDRKSSCFIKN